jgi:hypothetical protein
MVVALAVPPETHWEPLTTVVLTAVPPELTISVLPLIVCALAVPPDATTRVTPLPSAKLLRAKPAAISRAPPELMAVPLAAARRRVPAPRRS